MEENKSKSSIIISSIKNNTLLIFFTLFISALSFALGAVTTKMSYKGSTLAGGGTGNGNGSAAAGVPAAGQKDARQVMEQIASDLKLDKKKFDSCLDNGNFANKVSSNEQEGAKAGVSGTPGNFLVNLDTGAIIQLPGAVPLTMVQGVYDYLTKGTALPDGIKAPDKKPDLVMPNKNLDHIRGNTNARIALIEYSDFSCPFCKRFHETAQQFLAANPDKVMWVYRHFPLPQLHPNAQKQSEASECAAQLGGNDVFWKYADALYASQQ